MSSIRTFLATALILLATAPAIAAESAPDLRPWNLYHDPYVLVAGDPATFRVTVATTDMPAGAAFAADLFLDGAFLARLQGSANGYWWGSTYLTSPAWMATAGSHELRIVIDPEDAFRESDESNNELITTFFVYAGLADLRSEILDLRHVPLRTWTGDEFVNPTGRLAIDIRVCNTAAYPADDVTFDLNVFAGDGLLDVGRASEHVAWVPVGSLAAGVCVDRTYEWSGTAIGDVRVRLDAWGTPERAVGDNVAERSTFILVGGAGGAILL